MKEQDKIIKSLLTKIEEKKSELQKTNIKNMKTNCVFYHPFDKKDRINIHTVDEITLIDCVAALINYKNTWEQATKLISSDKKFQWGSYSFEDWIHDFQLRLNIINEKSKKEQLNQLQKRLDAIVSPDLKAQLEIEAISKELED